MEEKFETYVCSYRYQGSNWHLEIQATSVEDAKARLNAIHFGRVDGVHEFDIPDGPGAGVLARLICAVNNFFRTT